MNLQQLTRLIANGESDRLEFKKSTGELKGGLETLCGFLNGSGGRVLFGVSQSGRIVGQEISDSTLQDVAREISRLEPPANIAQSRLSAPPAAAPWTSWGKATRPPRPSASDVAVSAWEVPIRQL